MERAKAQAVRAVAAARAATGRIDHEEERKELLALQRQLRVQMATDARLGRTRAIDQARHELIEERASYRESYRLELRCRETQAYAEGKKLDVQQAHRVATTAQQRNSARTAVERAKKVTATRTRQAERDYMAECHDQAAAESSVYLRRAQAAANQRSIHKRNICSARNELHETRHGYAAELRTRLQHDEEATIPAARQSVYDTRKASAQDVHQRLSPEKVLLMKQREAERKRAIADSMKAVHQQTDLKVNIVRTREADRRRCLHDAIVEQRFAPKWPSAVRTAQPSLEALKAELAHPTRCTVESGQLSHMQHVTKELALAVPQLAEPVAAEYDEDRSSAEALAHLC